MEMTDDMLIQSVDTMQEELINILEELNRLRTEVMQMQEVPKQTFTSLEDERAHVFRFLFNLQKTGITNMLGADDYIQKRFGFTKAKSLEYSFEYIDNYDELRVVYSKASVKALKVPSVKKRKSSTPPESLEPEASVAKIEVSEPLDVPLVSEPKKKIIKIKKKAVGSTEEQKPKGVLIWNSFMNTVKAEMFQKSGVEPSYDEVRKKSIEMKKSDPESYKLFSICMTEEPIAIHNSTN
jgi:hypothetical protein